MSMLTPPGMGGKYKVTGNTYPRMRRHHRRRRKIMLTTAVVTAVSVLSWGTLELIDVFSGHRDASAAQKPKCRTSVEDKNAKRGAQPPLDLPKPDMITVNVYNATPRTGLAKQTADELQKRGFKIGKVGNAPAEHDKKIKETALLLSSPGAKDPLTVLGAHISGERTAEQTAKADKPQNGEKGGSIDFLIGDAFQQLEPTADADKILTDLAEPAPAAPQKEKC